MFEAAAGYDVWWTLVEIASAHGRLKGLDSFT
jgi:hypothetical protein